MKRHVNIPIFIPHLGCPNNCVFCNQRSISGHEDFVKESVSEEIEAALSTVDADAFVEIAFFGGSFTGIDRELMIYLLDVAEGYIKKGLVSEIRMSTRPDYISSEILEILSRYTVGTIELGLQSMDDEVLALSNRGHDKDIALRACRMIKDAGYRLIGQMMIGLPGSDIEKERDTAALICSLGADGARVYPTVVFYGTELCNMAMRGDYKPLEDDDAVYRTKEVLSVFDAHSVPCIRVGLCASDNLSDGARVYGGANHSAIGERAMSLLFRDRIEEKLKGAGHCGTDVTVLVPTGATSKASGQKRSNKLYFEEKYGIKRMRIKETESLVGYNVSVVTEREKSANS